MTKFGGSASSPTTAKPLMQLLYPRPRIKPSKAKIKAVVLLPDLPFLSQADWQQQNRMHAFKQVFGEDGEANLLAESLPRIPGSHPQNLKKKRGGSNRCGSGGL